LVSLNASRASARVKGAMTSLRGTLPIIITCNDDNNPVTDRVAGNQICASAAGSDYVAGGTFNLTCSFDVSTAGDSSTNIRCQCLTQACDLL
jgi:hypothetical protein